MKKVIVLHRKLIRNVAISFAFIKICRSVVAFGEKLRFVGGQAKQTMNTHPQNCVFNLNRMIGRPLDDPDVQREKQLLGCELISGSTGEVAAKVNYMNEKHEYSVTQLMAMLMVKLKTSVEASLGIKSMKDCVISVPCFFTDVERQCMMNAANIAGLNCLKLLNETTAVALTYGIFRTDFPPEPTPDSKEAATPGFVGKSKLVAFIDIGHASSQLCLVAFNAGKLRVVTSVFDKHLGGRDFDHRLFNHFVEEFKQKYKVDVNSKRRAVMRLMTECERIKRLMSANSSPIQLNIDCLIEDRDVSSKMCRADFEEMCADLINRVEQLTASLLAKAGVQASEIDDVEIIGGATRMPCLKDRITKIFGREPSTTINADEAVARGSAIQCAILSPNFRVRDFAVSDCLLYPVTINWDKTSENEENEMIIFDSTDKVPASKMLTLNKTAPFGVSARYTNPDEVPHPVKNVGKYMVRDIPPNSSKVKVKVRVSKHGYFQVAEATAYEKVVEMVAEEPPKVEQPKDGQPMEQSQGENGNGEGNGKGAEMEGNGANGDLDGVEEAKKPVMKEKVKTKTYDLPIDYVDVPGIITELQMRDFIEKENAIQSQNKMERDRVDAKNSLEEYALNMNREIQESFQPFASQEESKKLTEMCDFVNNWLYDEGEEQPKSVYNEKLGELMVCFLYFFSLRVTPLYFLFISENRRTHPQTLSRGPISATSF